MKPIKKRRLERAGWVVGDNAQFLQLSVEENRFIELKLALATGVRELRERKGLTQAALAHRLGSSQSRVAKMEAADRSVSLDLIMRSLLTIGATATEIAKWIKRAETARADAFPRAEPVRKRPRTSAKRSKVT
jgi:DNA-binding transcriptional regulator YiaG